MTSDTVINKDGIILQHGKKNDRVYIMKFKDHHTPHVLGLAEELAIKHGYSKIFAKIPQHTGISFLKAGYKIEAMVPSFFKGKEDGWFMKKYLKPTAQKIHPDEMKFYSQKNIASAPLEKIPAMPEAYTIRSLTHTDLPSLAALFQTVFPQYPFPIHETQYLKKSMAWTYYLGIFHSEQGLVGASSIELDRENRNGELTDFAIKPQHRGMGLALQLLVQMEKFLIKEDFLTGYTIARLREPGMNKTFAKAGYRYNGTLINNTNIMSGVESMNVWYKNYK